MTKKANLSAALHEASGKKPAVAIPTPANSEPAATAIRKPPSRLGKRVVAGHFDPVVIRQLKLLAMDNDTSIQAMLAEAINDLFVKHNMKQLA